MCSSFFVISVRCLSKSFVFVSFLFCGNFIVIKICYSFLLNSFRLNGFGFYRSNKLGFNKWYLCCSLNNFFCYRLKITVSGNIAAGCFLELLQAQPNSVTLAWLSITGEIN